MKQKKTSFWHCICWLQSCCLNMVLFTLSRICRDSSTWHRCRAKREIRTALLMCCSSRRLGSKFDCFINYGLIGYGFQFAFQEWRCFYFCLFSASDRKEGIGWIGISIGGCQVGRAGWELRLRATLRAIYSWSRIWITSFRSVDLAAIKNGRFPSQFWSCFWRMQLSTRQF